MRKGKGRTGAPLIHTAHGCLRGGPRPKRSVTSERAHNISHNVCSYRQTARSNTACPRVLDSASMNLPSIISQHKKARTQATQPPTGLAPSPNRFMRPVRNSFFETNTHRKVAREARFAARLSSPQRQTTDRTPPPHNTPTFRDANTQTHIGEGNPRKTLDGALSRPLLLSLQWHTSRPAHWTDTYTHTRHKHTTHDTDTT
jgi:hypothetical protein